VSAYRLLSAFKTHEITAIVEALKMLERKFDGNWERKCADTVGTVPVPLAGHFQY